MLLSGIHFNFSYSDYYLQKRFDASAETDFSRFVERRYLDLAEKAAAYSWLIVALTGASPVHDGSYWDAHARGKKGVDGYASLRNSEHGYWNAFIPTFDYTSLSAYADSVRRYVRNGQLKEERELYYPIRLKPAGMFTARNLLGGISHLELRMIDLNPLDPAGIDRRDIEFFLLLLAWLEYQPALRADAVQQAAFVSNVREASRMPLEDVELIDPDGKRSLLLDRANSTLEEMGRLLGRHPALAYQQEKLAHPERRYAHIIAKRYPDRFVERALADVEKQTQQILQEITMSSADGMNI